VCGHGQTSLAVAPLGGSLEYSIVVGQRAQWVGVDTVACEAGDLGDPHRVGWGLSRGEKRDTQGTSLRFCGECGFLGFNWG